MSNLTECQIALRKKARELKLGEPPPPWLNHQIRVVSSAFAAGWTTNNLFLILSFDGYSLTNPENGDMVLFVEDEESVHTNTSEDSSRFHLPQSNESVPIMGIYGGDGLHSIKDWKVEIIYPWWPEPCVVLHQNGLWNTVYALKIEGFDVGGDWIKCGFSPSGNSLAVVGHGGVNFFSRV